MGIQELQALLRELLQAIEQVAASGEELSDEFQGMLAETLANLMQRIEQAKAGGEQAPLAAPTENIQEAMPSSNVEGFSYDDKSGKLLVRFLGDYPNRQGSIYAYGGVPREIFDMFQKGAVPARTDGQNRWGKWWKGKVPSIGASLYTLIKERGYPYQKVS